LASPDATPAGGGHDDSWNATPTWNELTDHACHVAFGRACVAGDIQDALDALRGSHACAAYGSGSFQCELASSDFTCQTQACVWQFADAAAFVDPTGLSAIVSAGHTCIAGGDCGTVPLAILGVIPILRPEGAVARGAEDLARVFDLGADNYLFWSGNTGNVSAGSVTNLLSGGNRLTISQALTNSGIDISSLTGRDAWRPISTLWAESAKGEVTVVLGDNVSPKSVWVQNELPTLMANPNVTGIRALDLNLNYRWYVSP
jgi:hypothetical protein